MKNSKSFAHNTIILFASMIITKIVGALFKIPLTNIIGGVGMGYYSTAYSLYSPVFALTAAAIPTVIVKAVANCASHSNNYSAVKILRTALVTFGAIGLVGTGIILALAVPFADLVAKSPESALSIAMIAPSVTLCCISSVFKGYYEGMCNMMPTAVSQVIEAISRAAFGLVVSLFIVNYGMNCFENGVAVYGAFADSKEEAMHIILPYAAAGAVAAVTFSELCAAVCLIIRYKFGKHNNKIYGGECSGSFTVIAKNLIKESIPISLGAIAVNLSSFVDLVTIPRCIGYSITANPLYFSEAMGEIISSQGGTVRLSNFLYGSYTGVATTMFMLIPAFTGMLGRSALPEIASAWTCRNKALFHRKLVVVLKSNFIIGFPLYLGLAALSEPFLNLLYAGRPDEAAVSIMPLFILCIGGVFMTLATTFFSVLQVIGRADIPIKLVLTASAIKLILNVFLITIPQINISGAAISAVAANAVAAFGGYLALENVTGDDFSVFKAMFSPLLSGIVCAIAATLTMMYVRFSENSLIRLCCAVFVGGVFYIILLILTGGISIKNLLNRQKIKK